MAQYVSPAQLDGLFKEIYGDTVENLIPEVARITKMVPFEGREKELGDSYHQPVTLSQEQGFTFAANAAGAFALNDHIALTMKDATVNGSQILLRSALSYDAAAKASKGGKKAFKSSSEALIENMVESMAKKLEIVCLYGGGSTGIGQVDSSVNTDATHTVATFLQAQWAPGIWSGSEGMKLDAYHTSFGTKLSANAAFVVDSVDYANRAITLSGNSTDIAAFDTQAAAGTVELVFYGAYGAEMNGLDVQTINTGTLFGIAGASFALWQGNTYAVGGAITMGKILDSLVAPIARGGLQEKVTVFVPCRAWEVLNDDLAALRVLDQSYKPSKGESGVESIMYHGASGPIEIIGHSCVKEGEAFAVPLKRCKRIGEQDVSFKTPGRGDQIFDHLPSNAGYELRCYTSQALFIEHLAKCTKLTGITYS
jgi:hypothetical protein